MPRFSLQTNLPCESYDVVVAGGGLTGVCAAAAAARDGARVLLVEAMNALGGMASLGMVTGWCGLHDHKRVIHSGLCQEILRGSHPQAPEMDFVTKKPPIDFECVKNTCDRIVLESGAKLLFHTSVASVVREGDRITTAILCTKAGLSAVQAKVFVDCTGDADLAAWAGADYQKGDADGDMQPVSLCYLLDGVDGEAAKAELPDDWRLRLVDDPAYDLIRDSYMNYWGGNSGHLWNVDNTDPENLTRALVDGRRLVQQIIAGVRRMAPKGYANARLVQTASLLGVRETRRIVGEYELTLADYNARRRFDDDIALNSFFIDIHPSLAKRQQERDGTWSWEQEKRGSSYGPGEFHGIPYRCMVPKGLANVLVAGRSISCDREVLSAVRVMPPCMSMGEAAGLAAAQAARNSQSPNVRDVDVSAVQERLRKNGGFLPAPADCCSSGSAC